MDAEDWDARYRTSELIWTAEPNRFVVEVLEGATPGVGVDLACGEGRNAVWLAEQGWTMTAADFSGEALAKAAALAGARGVEIALVQADAVTWTPPAGQDLVLVAYLHLPAEERAAALAHAVGACRPGGRVVVVGHARANLDGGYGGPQDPAVLLEPAEVAGDLSAAGAEILRAEHVERTVHTEDGERTAVDTLVVAQRPWS
jgi:SAM-dependent methyltransferase